MATIAPYLAALIPQRNNAVSGVLVFYLVATAWMTVRRKEGSVAPFEYCDSCCRGRRCCRPDLRLAGDTQSQGQTRQVPAAIYFGTASIAAEIHTHYRADHNFDLVASMIGVSRIFKGT